MLNEIDYKQLQSSHSSWFCIICISEIFPFSFLTNDQLSLHLSNNTNINFDTHPPDLNIFPSPNKSNIFKDFNDFISPQISSSNNDDDDVSSPRINCKYYDIDEFSSSNFNKNTPFSLLHLNIASLAAHI